MTLIWRGNRVSKKIQSEARNRVKDVCLLVEGMVKSSMKAGGRTASGALEAQEYTTRTGRTSRRMVEPGTGKRAERTGSYRSKPGEVPRVQTGTLKRSITHELHPTLPIGRVGTNLAYAKPLELGTSKVSPRPFMRPAMHKAEPIAKGIFSKPMVGD